MQKIKKKKIILISLCNLLCCLLIMICLSGCGLFKSSYTRWSSNWKANTYHKEVGEQAKAEQLVGTWVYSTNKHGTGKSANYYDYKLSLFKDHTFILLLRTYTKRIWQRCSTPYVRYYKGTWVKTSDGAIKVTYTGEVPPLRNSKREEVFNLKKMENLFMSYNDELMNDIRQLAEDFMKTQSDAGRYSQKSTAVFSKGGGVYEVKFGLLKHSPRYYTLVEVILSKKYCKRIVLR